MSRLLIGILFLIVWPVIMQAQKYQKQKVDSVHAGTVYVDSPIRPEEEKTEPGNLPGAGLQKIKKPANPPCRLKVVQSNYFRNHNG